MNKCDSIIVMRCEADACANSYKWDAKHINEKAKDADKQLIDILYEWVSPYQKRPYRKLANGVEVRDHKQLLLNIAELMEPMECEMHVTESGGKKVIKCSACGKTIKPPAIDVIPKDLRELYHAEFAATAYRWLKYCPNCGSTVMDIRWDVE